MQIKIVFSVLYAETEDFLKYYIENFLLFSNLDDVLIVNYQGNYDPHKYTVENRIYIIVSEVKRYHFGATLLNGHIENYLFIKSIIKEDFIYSTLASNSLFYRKYDRQLIFNTLNAPESIRTLDKGLSIKDWYFKSRLENCAPFMNTFSNIVIHQIEGLTTFSRNWEEIASLKDSLLEITNNLDISESFPFEEVVPGSIFVKNKCPVIYLSLNHWGGLGNRRSKFVTVEDIFAKTFYAHCFLQKWFRRTSESLAVKFVTDKSLFDLVIALLNYSRTFGKISFSIAIMSLLFKNYEKNISLLSGFHFDIEVSGDQISNPATSIVYLGDDKFGPFMVVKKLAVEPEGTLRLCLKNNKFSIKNNLLIINEDKIFHAGIVYLPLPMDVKEVVCRYHTKENVAIEGIHWASLTDGSSTVQIEETHCFDNLIFGKAVGFSLDRLSGKPHFFGIPIRFIEDHEIDFFTIR